MTTGGWIFMLLSWTVIISVLIFCYRRSFGGDSNAQDSQDKQ
jgi:hypothetical protein